jgi:hypothetical protein
MSIHKKLEDKIRKKEQEIQEYATKINEAKVYIQALQEAIKLLPKSGTDESSESKIRPGSTIGKTLALLKKTGKPMHIDEILLAIGKSASKKDKMALGGSLGWYVRRHEVFNRTAPNTFGLIGGIEEPPDDFGVDKKDDENTIELSPF